MTAIDERTGYSISGENVDEMVAELNGGDLLAIYRNGFIDVYDADVTDLEAEEDTEGAEAYLHMEIID